MNATQKWVAGLFLAVLGAGTAAVTAYMATSGTPPPPATLRMLTAADFSYQGSILMPADVGPYSRGPIAWRPDTNTFLVTGADKYTGSPTGATAITEVTVPPVGQRASLVKAWAYSLYGGRRDAGGIGNAIPAQYLDPAMPATYKPYDVETIGLLAVPGKVYWTYQDTYNVSGWTGAPCVGMSTFNADGTATCYGPWTCEAGSKRSGGYIVQMPDGSLSFGSPIMSGDSNSSAGPNLEPHATPDTTTPAYSMLHRLAPPFLFFTWDARCQRDGNYQVPAPALNTNGDIAPVNGVGVINHGMFKATGAAYVQTATAHALVVVARQPTGWVWYGHADGTSNDGVTALVPAGITDTAVPDGTGPHAQGYEWALFLFDPSNWSTPPVQVTLGGPCGADSYVGGLAYNSTAKLLYTIHPWADQSVTGVPNLPVVQVRQITAP